jgi:hypothetical protein
MQARSNPEKKQTYNIYGKEGMFTVSLLITLSWHALQILSNPEKRQVYDIYGKEGLTAGLQVGNPLKTTEQLKQEWEAFKAQQVSLRSIMMDTVS